MGFTSAMEDAFSDVRSLSERMLLDRDNVSSPLAPPLATPVDEDPDCDGSESATRGADVGGGPRGSGMVSCEDSDCDMGESGSGDLRSMWLGRLRAEMCGLCMADGATDGAADGNGLA